MISLPFYLYHATRPENVAAILRDGLNPALSQSYLKAIYMSDSDGWALNMVCGMYRIRDVVIFRVESGRLDYLKFRPDDLYNHEWGLKHKKESGEPDWLTSLNILGAMAYEDNIPAELLRVHEFENQPSKDYLGGLLERHERF